MPNTISISEGLGQILLDKGAKLIGFGDMKGISNSHMSYGAAVAVPVPVSIVEGIQEGPTKEYYDMYYELNAKLNEIISAGAKYLEQQGYQAIAQTTDTVAWEDEWQTKLPHKTVATRAGLGWIGKSCLLVTPEYGSAIRISSLITDAPLVCNEPIVASKCGKCKICVEACPANALSGALWEPGVKREELFQKEICKKKQMELMKQRTGIETDLCGKCFVVCPYTQKYIKMRNR